MTVHVANVLLSIAYGYSETVHFYHDTFILASAPLSPLLARRFEFSGHPPGEDSRPPFDYRSLLGWVQAVVVAVFEEHCHPLSLPQNVSSTKNPVYVASASVGADSSRDVLASHEWMCSSKTASKISSMRFRTSSGPSSEPRIPRSSFPFLPATSNAKEEERSAEEPSFTLGMSCWTGRSLFENRTLLWVKCRRWIVLRLFLILMTLLEAIKDGEVNTRHMVTSRTSHRRSKK
jgi:hypothetical protein